MASVARKGQPFQLFKAVGNVLELIPNTPNFRTLGGALDWAQRWVRLPGSARGCTSLTCKQGASVRFRVNLDGFVSLGPGPFSHPLPRFPEPLRCEPRQPRPNIAKVTE